MAPHWILDFALTLSPSLRSLKMWPSVSELLICRNQKHGRNDMIRHLSTRLNWKISSVIWNDESTSFQAKPSHSQKIKLRRNIEKNQLYITEMRSYFFLPKNPTIHETTKKNSTCRKNVSCFTGTSKKTRLNLTELSMRAQVRTGWKVAAPRKSKTKQRI